MCYDMVMGQNRTKRDKKGQKPFRMYDENGYFNFASLYEQGRIFNVVIGARGTGKTYSAVKYFIEQKKPFLFMRRTQIQTDIVSTDAMSPIVKVLNDLRMEYHTKKLTKYNTAFYDASDKLLLVTASLKTFANIRGFEVSNVGINDIIFDEFVKEPQEPKIKYEGLAFSNAYESMNRNRFDGSDIRVFLLANSTDIANDVFMYFNWIPLAEHMIQSGAEETFLPDLAMLIYRNSPISEKKRNTALYRNVSKEFADMALDNKFVLNDFSYVKKQRLRDFSCSLRVGKLYIYKHKSEPIWYITQTKGTAPAEYDDNYSGLERFKKKHWTLYIRYTEGKVRFDSYESLSIFEHSCE